MSLNPILNDSSSIHIDSVLNQVINSTSEYTFVNNSFSDENIDKTETEMIMIFLDNNHDYNMRIMLNLCMIKLNYNFLSSFFFIFLLNLNFYSSLLLF